MAKLVFERENGARLFEDDYGLFWVKTLDDMPEIVNGNRTYVEVE